MLMNITISMAQTPVPMSGSFTINGETFTCISINSAYGANSPSKILTITNARIIYFPESAGYSATCTPKERKREMYRYSFQYNKPNAMKMTAILKTVFSPQRCSQLGNKRFDLGASVFPSTNAFNCTDYIITTAGTNTLITQEEIAQLDHLIRTTANFTFPRIKGTCSTISSISLNGIEFRFNELYTDPWLNGTDRSWDADQQELD